LLYSTQVTDGDDHGQVGGPSTPEVDNRRAFAITAG
jgi:hypothetical protein